MHRRNPLALRAADKQRFQTIEDYIEFARAFLDYVSGNLQAVIVSRNELHYNGVVLTDALYMEGITKPTKPYFPGIDQLSAVVQALSPVHTVPFTLSVIVMLAGVRFDAALYKAVVVLLDGVVVPRLIENCRAAASVPPVSIS